jgi:membrane associated rhomboid family serine protease
MRIHPFELHHLALQADRGIRVELGTERVMAGEWWRAVTALTLHADAPHVGGNAVAIGVLMTAVCWHLGPGLGAWLLLLAGAAGNLLTAAVHGGGHSSVGASTAVFA